MTYKKILIYAFTSHIMSMLMILLAIYFLYTHSTHFKWTYLNSTSLHWHFASFLGRRKEKEWNVSRPFCRFPPNFDFTITLTCYYHWMNEGDGKTLIHLSFFHLSNLVCDFTILPVCWLDLTERKKLTTTDIPSQVK